MAAGLATAPSRGEGRTPVERRTPRYGALLELSGMIRLTGGTLRRLVTPPFSWRGELVAQAALVIRRCLLPLAVSSAAFIFGVGVMLSGGTLNVLGVPDRLGGGIAFAATREFATWITGMLVAGIAGTAICSDLGARKVRDELDALAVLGTDPIRQLILPRYLALVLMAPLMYLWTAFIGAVVAALGNAWLYGVPIASYVASFNTLVFVDVVGALLKTSIFGVVIATVFCFKGMNARGGSEGVGRQVNQAVVIVFAAIWTLNFIFNATYLAAFPETQALR